MTYISVVIPNYNSSKTIKQTIHALCNQTYSDFDVTIVDDGSQDDSSTLIKDSIQANQKFKLIELPKNQGASFARNIGAENSKGAILLFTDSDVVLKNDTLYRAAKFFQNNSTSHALVGLPDKNSSFHNLPSEHFNLRVHHNYINLPREINILYTSICAVQRDAFNQVDGFNTRMRSEEDPELGFRLSRAGYVIISDKELSVYHNKWISLTGLLKNDYKRSLSRVKLMFRERATKTILKKETFISTPITQIYSALVMPFVWLSLFISIFNPLILISTGLLLLFFLKLNFGYLTFTLEEKGFFTTLKLYGLLLIDMTAVDFGIFVGLLKYIAGEKY